MEEPPEVHNAGGSLLPAIGLLDSRIQGVDDRATSLVWCVKPAREVTRLPASVFLRRLGQTPGPTNGRLRGCLVRADPVQTSGPAA